MSMVSGDKPSLCSCSRTSGILAALGFCEAGVVSRVSRVDVGCLVFPHSLEECVDYTEREKGIEFKTT